MILSETINGMVSNDYKERFIAEYQQLSIRYSSLKKMYDNWDNLAFTPTCPRSTYELQLKAMAEYKAVLRARAVLEGVNLDENTPTVAKYRKIPVVIEAYQTNEEMIIPTLEGDMHASVGDYIITGINGEKYPCKPDIFKKTYEKVEE